MRVWWPQVLLSTASCSSLQGDRWWQSLHNDRPQPVCHVHAYLRLSYPRSRPHTSLLTDQHHTSSLFFLEKVSMGQSARFLAGSRDLSSWSIPALSHSPRGIILERSEQHVLSQYIRDVQQKQLQTGNWSQDYVWSGDSTRLQHISAGKYRKCFLLDRENIWIERGGWRQGKATECLVSSNKCNSLGKSRWIGIRLIVNLSISSFNKNFGDSL